ncbi:metallophosphoesterase family protein [Acidicapsa acidisoli]|uniref:metallophosphoesterase family protein n=1 Tax=Acidicapsa acidisoli TaxID=1615681 RepID=UPI0021DFCE1E|nr:metallophosphoesterase family protein [Acidicapsa acidisoli]
MRIAIVSDIHGNSTALEAVLADLKLTAPDVVFHGGDLADAGSSPAEVVDRVRELGWPGVVGNTDEMLFRPEALREFARNSPGLQGMWAVIEEMEAATRELLGEDRVAWLASLPRSQFYGPMALVHASPESLWRAPSPEASDAELESVYGALGKPVAVYGHIHQPYIRGVSGRIIANTGSVSLSYDGDCRAAYLLLDENDSVVNPTIRRVEYDLETELRRLAACGLPHVDWIARTLKSARPQMP